ncbi:cytochrome B5-like protein [Cucumis melo var. makuwa]|uniref:Cytochrome B5-like protein n=1 Tax=Cucumis melo var. makuwa TaxID=1194695 RepID=A0A5D3CHS0_CUCMM|nr:cytochrome B5-like protein [Cucumis melo var. makuwa]
MKGCNSTLYRRRQNLFNSEPKPRSKPKGKSGLSRNPKPESELAGDPYPVYVLTGIRWYLAEYSGILRVILVSIFPVNSFWYSVRRTVDNLSDSISKSDREVRKMVIVIAALLLSVLLGALFLIPRDRNAQKVQLNPINKSSKVYYSKDEVSVHNKRTDCWVIIKNKVYDVTSYVEEHPGGDAILTHAGDDSTEGFYG